MKICNKAEMTVNEQENFEISRALVEQRIKELRAKTPNLPFKKTELAEVEINKFFFDGETVDRVMIVLRSNGCQHYKKNGGCSMCSHLNGAPLDDKITHEHYVAQWDSVILGRINENNDFYLNDYPVVCVYNLGSLLNAEEISLKTLKYIFSTLNVFKKVKKVIIESRAEYVTEEVLQAIAEVYDGLVEVGIGVESTNYEIRELCHHKAIEDENVFCTAVKLLHKFGMRALAYVNFKPVFLTEQEAIDDAISTSVDCFKKYGFDAVSVEPTSLQDNSLANHLYEMGYYRVPWLWSLRDIIHGIYDNIPNETLDIRIGGYFDEEVLSGSQGVGFEGKNEIFPHLTSSNCIHCTGSFIDAVKKFNMTYDVASLDEVCSCKHCYNLWKNTKKIKDSRSITERIKDILSEADLDENCM